VPVFSVTPRVVGLLVPKPPVFTNALRAFAVNFEDENTADKEGFGGIRDNTGSCDGRGLGGGQSWYLAHLIPSVFRRTYRFTASYLNDAITDDLPACGLSSVSRFCSTLFVCRQASDYNQDCAEKVVKRPEMFHERR
jgi:hypothetical protein